MSSLVMTSDQILASARNFIVSGGYNGFSYADIAEVVGVRKASIHHHFPSKVDLVRTLVARHRERTEVSMADLESKFPDPLALLQTYAGYWAKCIEDASVPFCVCALLASELPALPPEVAVEVRAYFRSLSSWLTKVMNRGAEQGILKFAGSAELEAETFMATVHGAMLSARANGNPALFDAILTPTVQRLSAKVH
ncbi:MAG: TetR/AcrR family transcriptional regulator [Mesorhizobium sp.]|nr:TetR/AcrR family transcriptional regulator [bacterium M00.F.Ca.ET.205.01.1.1]TGU50627.1 TetR/AcrR family transcriptional regulator [bacterium M00.F.Ca.ET.152.01.1.1]TGV34085.1 TetR/AcrR family transcriptional regulator [Mesorhizobium sp. M00.F.Ca.ET.186.01.1.1]TGZ40991.1 TetR/AcrR family transcriptional regulator [bacterium M00.F.Ca.ET.162.01.1.1]TJW32025.1 MAG: TetR/AcrR family transcriptional regulator [Mesorhizobium sp.]